MSTFGFIVHFQQNQSVGLGSRAGSSFSGRHAMHQNFSGKLLRVLWGDAITTLAILDNADPHFHLYIGTVVVQKVFKILPNCGVHYTILYTAPLAETLFSSILIIHHATLRWFVNILAQTTYWTITDQCMCEWYLLLSYALALLCQSSEPFP